MLWTSERVAHEDRRDVSFLPEGVWAPETDERFPTAEEVIGDMATTLAGFLAIALAVNLLLLVFGV